MSRIHDAPRHCNRRKQRAKPSHLTELYVLLSVLALLDASIGKIEIYLLNRSKMLPFSGVFSFGKCQVRGIRWLRHDYGFVFGPNLMHKHQCVSWWLNMVQNPWLVFPKFYAFLTNSFVAIRAQLQGSIPYWPHNLVARIHDAPCHCNLRKQWAKPSHLTKLSVLFSFLALLDASIGMIEIYLLNRGKMLSFQRRL